MICEYKDRVLDYLKNDLTDDEIEAHIEQCEQCKAMVEGYLEKEKELLPEIPRIDSDSPGQKFNLRVIKYNRGKSRIILFTVIGLIMGWLSFNYTMDTFFITKFIMAIPYKISEIIYTTLHEVPYIYRTQGVFNEFFPQSMIVTFMAERFTPVLVGGAIYGSIGYFTGDKKIFTLSKYLKFAAVWCGIILLWIGIVFAGNTISNRENSELKDIRGFFLNAEDHGDGFYVDDENTRGETFELLYNALGNVSQLKDINHYEITDNQTTVEIYMGIGRYCLTTVNWEEKFMILDTGRVIAIPDAFAKLVREYYNGNGYFTEPYASKTDSSEMEENNNETSD